MYWLISLLCFKRHVFFRVFLFAYGAFILSAIDNYVLRRFGIFWLDITAGQLKIGSLIEIVIFSIVLVYSFEKLRRENQHYRNEIDKYMQNEMILNITKINNDADVLDKVQLKYGLTDREVEVLKGINDGLTNNQIGDRLFLSVNTIKFHTRNIMAVYMLF